MASFRTSARVGSGSWPLGLLGMLALVACVERGVSRNAPRFVTIDATSWARARSVAGRSADARVVALGDSLVKHGIVPAVVERRIGRPACNLAVTGGHAPGHYFQLRRLLGTGARPDAVLVDGDTLGEDPLGLVRVWPELLGVAECGELALAARDALALAAMTLGRLLPTYRARAEARAGVLDALGGRPPAVAAMLPMFERNWRKNREALLLPPRDDAAGPDPRLAALRRIDGRSAAWSCHPVNAVFVERLLDLAASREVPVFWLLPPLHPEVQARDDRTGSGEGYHRFLRSLTARHPNLSVIDGRHAGYPAGALADFVHLARPGALAFSDAVAAVVGERLSVRPTDSAWIALPPWREGAAAEVEAVVAVEDVRQSSQAFERYAEVRRLAQGRALGGTRSTRSMPGAGNVKRGSKIRE